MEFLQAVDFAAILLVAAVTTIIVSAFNAATPSWVKPQWLTPVIALFATALKIQIVKGMTFADWQQLLFGAMLTWAFAVLFYQYTGKKYVDKLFDEIAKKLGLNQNNAPPNP